MAKFKLPLPLADASSQIAHAKLLCSRHLNQPTPSAFLCSDQGNYSVTLTVISADNGKHIIQFRDSAQDCEPYLNARKHVGDLVPDVQYLQDAELERAGIWSYYMTLVPGRTWREVEARLTTAQIVACSRSLGRAFARCIVQGSSSGEVVEEYIKPRLRTILEHKHRPELVQHVEAIEQLLSRADELKVLPLAVTHADLRQMNIMVHEDLSAVTGIIDWEYSEPLLKPFGLQFYTFYYLASHYDWVKDVFISKRIDYDEMNEALWDGVLEGCDKSVRDVLVKHWAALQTSILIGIVLDKIQIEDDGVVNFHKPALDVLGEHLTYRLPTPPF